MDVDAIAAARIDVLTADGLDVASARFEQGMHHDVIVLAEVAARFPRTQRTLELSRYRIELIEAIDSLGLPVDLPRLVAAELDRELGRAYVLQRVVPGIELAADDTPRERLLAGLEGLLTAMSHADVSLLPPVPHRHALFGGDALAILRDELADRLPPQKVEEWIAVLETAAALPALRPVLVHGDLWEKHLRWDPETGALVSVIDWDLAHSGDPGVDAACLSEYGWDVVTDLFAPDVVERARVIKRSFPPIIAAEAYLLGEPRLLDHLLQNARDELKSRAPQ